VYTGEVYAGEVYAFGLGDVPDILTIQKLLDATSNLARALP